MPEHFLARGSVLPGFSGPLPDGPRFHFDASGPSVLLALARPTPREIRGVRSGRIRFGLLPFGKHTLFVLMQQSEGLKSWSDMPFALGLNPPEGRELPERAEAQGYGVHLTLVDARSGMVHALRWISVTPAFAAALDGAVGQQRAHFGEFSAAAHKAEIAEAYRRFPTADHMASKALAIELGGLPFGHGEG